MIAEFAKEKVFWTHKMNLKLVKFIESRPHMWNPRHPKYTSTDYRDSTYAEFAAKYNFEFSGQAVKDRWTNIRSTFANYLRKLNATHELGQVYKVNWHLWESCHFLHRVHRKMKGEPTTSNNCSDAEAQDGELDTEQEMKPEINTDGMLPISIETDNLSQSNTDCSSLFQGLVSVFKSAQNDSFGLGNSKHAKVGRIVTKKLARMNSYDAARASQRILEILTLYDENNPDNPNQLKNDIT